MNKSQKKIIDNMSVKELREGISRWTTLGHHHLVPHAEDRLAFLTVVKQDAVIPTAEDVSHE